MPWITHFLSWPLCNREPPSDFADLQDRDTRPCRSTRVDRTVTRPAVLACQLTLSCWLKFGAIKWRRLSSFGRERCFRHGVTLCFSFSSTGQRSWSCTRARAALSGWWTPYDVMVSRTAWPKQELFHLAATVQNIIDSNESSDFNLNFYGLGGWDDRIATPATSTGFRPREPNAHGAHGFILVATSNSF